MGSTYIIIEHERRIRYYNSNYISAIIYNYRWTLFILNQGL